MKAETGKDVVNGVGAFAGSSGVVTAVMAYLKMNAVELGVIVSIITLIIYIIFQILYYKKLTLADENKLKHEVAEEKFDRQKEFTESEFKKVNSALSDILNYVQVNKE